MHAKVCCHSGETLVKINRFSRWTGTKPSGGGSSIGGGTIFIIFLVVLAVVYLVGFAAYYGVRHQKRGVDLIAHRTFWIALPVYARDGVLYLFHRVTGKGSGAYQSVWTRHFFVTASNHFE